MVDHDTQNGCVVISWTSISKRSADAYGGWGFNHGRSESVQGGGDSPTIRLGGWNIWIMLKNRAWHLTGPSEFSTNSLSSGQWMGEWLKGSDHAYKNGHYTNHGRILVIQMKTAASLGWWGFGGGVGRWWRVLNMPTKMDISLWGGDVGLWRVLVTLTKMGHLGWHLKGSDHSNKNQRFTPGWNIELEGH